MKSLPATSGGKLIRLLCWSIYSDGVGHLKTDGGSHVNLYLRRHFIGPRTITGMPHENFTEPAKPKISGRVLNFE